MKNSILMGFLLLFASSSFAFTKKNQLDFGYTRSSRTGNTSQRIENPYFKLSYDRKFLENTYIDFSISQGSRSNEIGIVGMATKYTDYQLSIERRIPFYSPLRVFLGIGMSTEETTNSLAAQSSSVSDNKSFLAVGFNVPLNIYEDMNFKADWTRNMIYEFGVSFRNELEDLENNIVDFNLISLGYQF
ncbi:MAG: hypothetical protein VX583_12855 [Bdellovibrionota bacterium]